jgi:hypothetical protein
MSVYLFAVTKFALLMQRLHSLHSLNLTSFRTELPQNVHEHMSLCCENAGLTNRDISKGKNTLTQNLMMH